MKKVVMTFAVAVALAAGTVFADGAAAKDAKDAKDAKAEAAPAKKAKPKPKRPTYNKLKAAKEAAADWGEPILLFLFKQGDEESGVLKRKVMQRKELKTFFATNCVVMQVELPLDRYGKPDMAKIKLDKDLTALYDGAKSVNGHGSMELPASFVLNEKGDVKGPVGKYVIDVGVGTWLSQFDAALKAAGYSGAKMTKEAQKLIDDNKPDGKARPQK